MFGYIKPYMPELKVKEQAIYKSMYCGLCKHLGKYYGQISRFTLNYDFAFISLLSASLTEDECFFDRKRCFVHPFKKRMFCLSEKYFKYVTSVAIIMLRYKAFDNFKDRGLKEKIISYLTYPFLYFKYKKASKKYPDIDDALRIMTLNQQKLERDKCDSIDVACEPTAKAMSVIAKGLYYGDDKSQIRVLERFGYILGRYVYMIDATDDIKKDIKNGNYNPFVIKYNLNKKTQEIDKIKQSTLPSIYLTIGELGKTYELMDIKRFNGLIENIIYLGLKSTTDTVIKKAEGV